MKKETDLAVILDGLTLTDSQKIKILLERASGHVLSKLVEDTPFSVGQFQAYLIKDTEFNRQFNIASDKGYDALAEELIHMVDKKGVDLGKARLKSENIKWVLSKRKPKTYGDKLDINVEQTLNLDLALSAAKSRAALILDEKPSKTVLDTRPAGQVKSETEFDE